MTCKGCRNENILVPFGVYNPCRYCYKFDHYIPIKEDEQEKFTEKDLRELLNPLREAFREVVKGVVNLTPAQQEHLNKIKLKNPEWDKNGGKKL